LKDGNVSFRWKDYTNNSKQRTMTLDAQEFIRRFLLHVLPSGFMRIRHYGFLANRCRRQKIVLCRELIGESADSDAVTDSMSTDDEDHKIQSSNERICPSCKKGCMVLIETKRVHAAELFAFEPYDTS
jgi:hypothetical protein